jgi:Na+/proline symporter
MESIQPLAGLDWAVIVAFFIVTLGIGLYFSKKATGSLTEYFVAGRKMTWWLAGTSIVATSFAADTPLVISGWMRTVGLERNWFWWGGIMGMMLCTFFFARLWRRATIITDVEFNELRYSGKPAAGLRIFHATYRSLIQNTLVMGWVTLAMTKIIEVTLDIPTIVFLKGKLAPVLVQKGLEIASVYDLSSVAQWPFVGAAIIPAKATYSAISGLWGVMATDFFQFSFAMTGTIILMVIVFVIADGPKRLVSQARDAVMQGQVINKRIFRRGEIELKVLSDKIGIKYPLDSNSQLPRQVDELSNSDATRSGNLGVGTISDRFPDSDPLRRLIEAGIFKNELAKDGKLLWAINGKTEDEIVEIVDLHEIRARRGIIAMWKDAYTINKAKFTNFVELDKIIKSDILVEDNSNDKKGFDYFRFSNISLSDDELSRRLEDAGVQDRSEFMAAWRGGRVVPTMKITNFLPPFDIKGGGLMAIWSLVVFLGLQWWAGGEGGGFLAQRLFSCKNEKHSVLAMLWFNLAHFVIRPWPWIVVGVGSLFLIPDITAYGADYDQEYAYVVMLMKYLPVGLKGLMVASLMAAYMSTISTHVNFGASYIVNDLYNRFLDRSGSEARQILVSQVSSVSLAVLAGVCAFYMKTIDQGWFLMFELMSGVGFVVLLRWYWWRISAWSELAAMFSSLLMYYLMNKTKIFHMAFNLIGAPESWLAEYPVRFSLNLLLTTILWISVTFLTSPEKEEHLIKFYRRVPAGWWTEIASKAGNPHHLVVGWTEWACWGLGVSGLFAMIACLGKACFGLYFQSFLFAVFSTITTVLLFKLLGKMDWSGIDQSA